MKLILNKTFNNNTSDNPHDSKIKKSKTKESHFSMENINHQQLHEHLILKIIYYAGNSNMWCRTSGMVGL